jgi:uncharacterized membrane protein
MKAKFHERISRSFVKAITYRLAILTSDAIIVLAITHRFDTTIGVVVGTNIASTLMYVIHERVWNKIHWGKAKK